MGDGATAIMATPDVVQGFMLQAEHCRRHGAEVTARVVEGLARVTAAADTACGRRMRAWPNPPLEDALPLRMAGGLHYLHLTGAEDALVPVYTGEVTGQAQVDALVADVVARHDMALLPWLDGPPQTNEAARSASLMAGMLWLAKRFGPRFEVNELGASAGINTMMERFRFDLGGVLVGPPDSPVRIVPEWRGPPPHDGAVTIEMIRGCDLHPVDLTDPEAAMRLRAYVWPEMRARFERLDGAIRLACARRPDVAAADAADWLEATLAGPQACGVTRLIQHSIVWQYIPDTGRQRIAAMMAAAGARASADRPLAWLRLETNRATFRHELSVRAWPGGGHEVVLAEAHAHGAWVAWRG